MRSWIDVLQQVMAIPYVLSAGFYDVPSNTLLSAVGDTSLSYPTAMEIRHSALRLLHTDQGQETEQPDRFKEMVVSSARHVHLLSTVGSTAAEPTTLAHVVMVPAGTNIALARLTLRSLTRPPTRIGSNATTSAENDAAAPTEPPGSPPRPASASAAPLPVRATRKPPGVPRPAQVDPPSEASMRKILDYLRALP
ncbi:hypothetical protein AB0D49_25480 [Streptomyces sp. NPDC048290]|uniref:hypothetical protein n=1 Tax=Streptomyces sp. NPDC048290 TaxID=3155811 RepID=UPI0034446289